jgi:hypothetical protein
MPHNSLDGECLVKHTQGAEVYPASLEGAWLLIHYGTPKDPRTCRVTTPRDWVLVRGSDYDLERIWAAGILIGDGRES